MSDRNNGSRVPTRDEISADLKWRLEDIFADDDAWEKEYLELKEVLKSADRYQGKVGESAGNLLAALKLEESVHLSVDRLAGYAIMRRDEDNQNTTYQAMTQRAITLASQAGSVLSYLTPEILQIPEETVEQYMKQEKDLETYRHALEDILRGKEHVLTPREEQILAEVGDLAQGPETVFTMLNHADLDFGTIANEEGEEVDLTLGRYIQFQRSQDRRVRKESFEQLYERYVGHKNTLAATFNSSVKTDVFYARMRRHNSALEAALHPDNVPRSVYDNLITTVRDNLPVLHRYLRLRRKLLGLDELHMYDLYVPLIRDVHFKIPYDQSRQTVKAGLYPLGDGYQDVLDEAFKSRWIDVYENVGKTSGAYVRDVYGTHPFVLLNYQSNIDDLFTLVHELGHAMHSHYSQAKQPYVYSDYSIFVAEVASTVNEALLVNYLLDAETDPRRRLYILNYYLEQFRTTVFRQTMFAEFERLAHDRLEAGEALTAESLCEWYRGLNLDYYGAEVTVDEQIDMEWSRVPHFYHAFYVYKYATGFSAANALAQGILAGKEDAVPRYLEFLQSGGSDYPLELLKKAGVDMTSPQPIEEALAVFDRLLEETEVLSAQRH